MCLRRRIVQTRISDTRWPQRLKYNHEDKIHNVCLLKTYPPHIPCRFLSRSAPQRNHRKRPVPFATYQCLTHTWYIPMPRPWRSGRRYMAHKHFVRTGLPLDHRDNLYKWIGRIHLGIYLLSRVNIPRYSMKMYRPGRFHTFLVLHLVFPNIVGTHPDYLWIPNPRDKFRRVQDLGSLCTFPFHILNTCHWSQLSNDQLYNKHMCLRRANCLRDMCLHIRIRTKYTQYIQNIL